MVVRGHALKRLRKPSLRNLLKIALHLHTGGSKPWDPRRLCLCARPLGGTGKVCSVQCAVCLLLLPLSLLRLSSPLSTPLPPHTHTHRFLLLLAVGPRPALSPIPFLCIEQYRHSTVYVICVCVYVYMYICICYMLYYGCYHFPFRVLTRR